MVLIAAHGAASRLLPAELHARLSGEAAAFVASGTATWWGSDQVWARTDRRFEGTEGVRVLVQVATARIHVREAGLRPRASSQVGGWRLQAMGRRPADPGLALRPDDIEIGAEVTADFLVDA